ncbi:uncharacterized protein LOC130681779 [Manis pentadactyla]|uniref:uncharacterized protein LOC130681779 n=1 Tax=Manis pentadactyla TaxID=143292 RepID=UPI00255C799E|nr:uncharacterized protein LOC130681779 [Manis pentadactyla]
MGVMELIHMPTYNDFKTCPLNLEDNLTTLQIGTDIHTHSQSPFLPNPDHVQGHLKRLLGARQRPVLLPRASMNPSSKRAQGAKCMCTHSARTRVHTKGPCTFLLPPGPAQPSSPSSAAWKGGHPARSGPGGSRAPLSGVPTCELGRRGGPGTRRLRRLRCRRLCGRPDSRTPNGSSLPGSGCPRFPSFQRRSLLPPIPQDGRPHSPRERRCWHRALCPRSSGVPSLPQAAFQSLEDASCLEGKGAGEAGWREHERGGEEISMSTARGYKLLPAPCFCYTKYLNVLLSLLTTAAILGGRTVRFPS